ncbi:uncharacterized protein [Amphiura filiformis]|uniref:uncharacterized protein n=1 Tax=Amphiura filiformis TaxID=82378 RepID=UPI003B220AF9
MNRKIYFCGSIRAGCQDRELYLRMIEKLQSYGQVLTEHVFYNIKDPSMDGMIPNPVTGKVKTDKEIHDGDVTWLDESSVVVAEVTQPSLGVGYEIGRAVAMNKKILCLFRSADTDKRLSAMIQGAHNNSTFIVKHYKEEEFPAILKEFFDQTLEKMSHKIYFCGSIRAGSQDRELYLRIIEKLHTYGQVLTENVFHYEDPLLETGKVRSSEEIHENYVTWLEECNVVVAEVTQPSLGVGYEIGRAVNMNKKILCLFRSADTDKHLSCMIQGAHNDSTFIVKQYKEEEVPAILKEFFDQL